MRIACRRARRQVLFVRPLESRLVGFRSGPAQLGADFGFAPLVIGASVTVFVATLLMSGNALGMGGVMKMLSPSTRVLLLFGTSGAMPVFGFGRWWTVFSAGWLHGSLIHIVFNVTWVRRDGCGHGRYDRAVANGDRVRGRRRRRLLPQLDGGAFLPPIAFLRGAAFTIGASAPVFGLLGALFHYGRASGSSHRAVAQSRWCGRPFGVVMGNSGIDNFAHVGGFVGGYLVSAFINPLTRERGDHLLVAFGCLVATAFRSPRPFLTTLFAVQLTVVQGFPPARRGSPAGPHYF